MNEKTLGVVHYSNIASPTQTNIENLHVYMHMKVSVLRWGNKDELGVGI